MAGLECIAAILGIAGVGIQLSATLYDFASSASTAKSDMYMVAESIDTYSSVLETLGRQLEASEAVCSAEGVRLAQDLQRQSEVLFKKIAENIPTSKGDGISMRQKMSWFFQKDRINFLLGQVEQLKATVSLLLQILILAQTSKPSTKTETNNVTNHNVTNNLNINVNVVNADINSQFRRAENRVMQYHNASVNFARLQIQDEQPVVRNALPWQEDFEELPVVRQTEDDNDVAASFGQLALRQPRMTSAATNANSAQLVGILLDHWTTVETNETTSTVMTEEMPDSTSSPVVSSPNECDSPLIDPMSRTDTVPDKYQPRSEVTSTVKVTSTGGSNPLKGWWQRYRQSAKTKNEEDERQRQLEKQESELKRRETQLQREQTLVERELKLQEGEKQKEEAKAKALEERERRLAESQKLQEAAHRQALAEKELRAETERRQKEARKEHLARLKNIRHNPRGLSRRESQNDSTTAVIRGSVDDNNDNVGNGTNTDVQTNIESADNTTTTNDTRPEFKAPSRVSTTSSLESTNVNTNNSSRPGPSLSRHNSPQLSQISNLLHNPTSSSSLSLTRSQTIPDSTTPTPSVPLTNTTSTKQTPPLQSLERAQTSLREAKALRKQKREEWKQARKAAKSKSKSTSKPISPADGASDDQQDDDSSAAG